MKPPNSLSTPMKPFTPLRYMLRLRLEHRKALIGLGFTPDDFRHPAWFPKLEIKIFEFFEQNKNNYTAPQFIKNCRIEILDALYPHDTEEEIFIFQFLETCLFFNQPTLPKKFDALITH